MNRIIRYISTVKSRPSAGLRAAGSIMAVCVAGFVALTLWGCQRKELQVQEYMAVVSIDNGVVGTKGMLPDDENTPQIDDIAIFAFSRDSLVGYLYESGLAQSRKTVFPMTLIRGGDIEFYVIANSATGFFKVVSGDDPGDDVGTVLSRTSTANPPSYTKDDIQSFRVEIGNRDLGEFWYAPMANLATKENGSENRTFNVSSGTGYTKIPVEVSRAVSKVKMCFVRPSKVDSFTISDQHYKIKNIDLFQKVNQTKLSDGQPVKAYYGQNYQKFNIYNPETNPTGNGSIDENGNDEGTISKVFVYDANGDVPSEYYNSEVAEMRELFQAFGQSYAFPDMYGGNNTSGNEPSQDSDKVSYVQVSYLEGNNEHERKIFLPTFERNTQVNIWCVLSSSGFDILYTVSDWDEMEIEVPGFK